VFVFCEKILTLATMLKFATFKCGLCHAGNLIAGI
jgi:hypothetical protein